MYNEKENKTWRIKFCIFRDVETITTIFIFYPQKDMSGHVGINRMFNNVKGRYF